jgi:hypothetical protein
VEIKDILNKKVSFQTTAWTSLSKEMTIYEVLNDIKSNKYFSIINSLRFFLRNNEIEKYNIHKKKLPAITFCGTFDSKRRREFLKEYNHIIVLDIDKLSLSEYQRVKKILENDEYVFAFWESPSQNGIKGLVHLSFKINFNIQSIDYFHKEAFIKLSTYFQEKYDIKLDESGSDTTRLCFMSFDPNLLLKNFVSSFNIEAIGQNESFVKPKINKITLSTFSKLDILYNPKNKNNPNHRKTIQSIIKFLTKRKLSITNTYEDWYRVAFAISNSFTYEIGEKYFLTLCQIDGARYNEIDCKNILLYSYENSRGEINFKTIEYFAKKQGYQNQRGGVPKVAN